MLLVRSPSVLGNRGRSVVGDGSNLKNLDKFWYTGEFDLVSVRAKVRASGDNGNQAGFLFRITVTAMVTVPAWHGHVV
jgi:hypothetical protein